jgi:hypothetical protein
MVKGGCEKKYFRAIDGSFPMFLVPRPQVIDSIHSIPVDKISNAISLI